MSTTLAGRIWFNTTQAGEYTGRHPKTILHALYDGELRGSQKHPRCSWRIHKDWLDAWLRGETP